MSRLTRPASRVFDTHEYCRFHITSIWSARGRENHIIEIEAVLRAPAESTRYKGLAELTSEVGPASSGFLDWYLELHCEYLYVLDIDLYCIVELSNPVLRSHKGFLRPVKAGRYLGYRELFNGERSVVIMFNRYCIFLTHPAIRQRITLPRSLSLFSSSSSSSDSTKDLDTVGQNAWKDRIEAEKSVERWLSEYPSTFITIQGPPGSGKQSLLNRVLKKEDK